MPSVDQLRVEYDDAITAGMNASAASIEKTAAALDHFATATSTSDQVITRSAKNIETVARSLDGEAAAAARAEAATRKREASLRSIQAAEEKGAITSADAARLRERATAQLEIDTAKAVAAGQAIEQRFNPAAAATTNLAASSGNAAFALRQLGVQSVQAISGIATGQGVLQVLIQQGHQVADVALSTGTGMSVFGAAAKAVAGFLAGPGGLVVAGAAAAGGLIYLAAQAETANRQLLSVQTSLRATRADFQAMGAEAIAAGKAVAASSGLSNTDAREVAQTIASASNFQGTRTQLQAMIRTADDLAAVMGVTAPEAARTLAQAMRDPAAEADKLAKASFPGMNAELARQIDLMQRAGDKAGAFERVLSVLKAQTEGAAEASKTGLQRALIDLENTFTATGAGGKSFANVLGEGITAGASGAINAITSVITKIEELRKKFPETTANATSGLGWMALLGPQLGPIASILSVGSGVSSNYQRGERQYGPFAASELPREAQALLNVIAGPESGGAYDIRYGGPSGAQYFGDFSRHPMIPEVAVNPATGRQSTSDAAGRYQFLSSTWGPIASQLGLNDFSPASQDRGAWALANSTYSQVTGRDLLSDLRSGGFETTITSALKGQWPSLAGGSQQLRTQVQFNGALAREMGAGQYGPPSPSSISGVTNTPADTAAAALDAQKALGVTGLRADTVQAQIKALNAQLAATPPTATEEIKRLNEALQRAGVELYNAVAPAQALLRTIGQQIDGETRVAAAWTDGSAAAAQMTIRIKAEAEARQFAAQGDANYATIVEALAGKYTDLAAASQLVSARAQENDQQKQLVYLKAEMATLGQSADIRTHDLATLKARQEVEKQFPLLAEAEKQKLVENSVAIADATFKFQQMQQSLNEFGNLITGIFDQVSGAIVNAFVNGSGAAVNFGNVARGVMTAVLNEAIKLTLLNPILNSVTGSNRTTLGGVIGALGGAGGSGGGGAYGTLSTASSLYSAGSSLLDALGYKSTLSWAGNQLGLTGQGGFLSGFSGLSDAATSAYINGTNLLATGINGNLLATSTNSALSSMGGLYGPATESSVLAASGGATLGNVIGGVGGGYALGSLAGGYVQSGLNKTGPAPQIGAGAGAVGGAVAGTLIFPGVGTVIGGLLGGLVGGVGGGFIGPQVGSSYTGTYINPSAGMIHVGDTQLQNADSNRSQVTSDAEAINAFLQASGIRLSSLGGVSQIGYPSTENAGKYPDIATAFPQFGFQSDNTELNSVISGKSFGSFSDLQTAYNFIVNTLPVLRDVGKTTGTLADQTKALNDQYDAAVATAQQVGYAEDELNGLRQKAVDKLNAQVSAQVAETIQGFDFRTRAANGSDPMQLALDEFDVAAKKQRTDFSDQLVAIYGDIFKSTSWYASDMAQLESALGAERLAIQEQYNDKLAQTASASVTNLTAYALKLQTGSASPLSAQDQLSLAQKQFDAVSGAAAAGDFNSLSQLPAYADTLLNTSRVVFGSGAAYVANFQKVLDALNNAANATPDTLTASVMISETRTQTQILSDDLQALKVAVQQVTAQLQQNGATPARIAA